VFKEEVDLKTIMIKCKNEVKYIDTLYYISFLKKVHTSLDQKAMPKQQLQAIHVYL
jgi:hypothetical protein